MWFEASAPGSLMLLGEYGVLYGKPALVCAIDKRIRVRLHPRTDQDINITSVLGQFSTTVSTLSIEKPFQFILGVLTHFQSELPAGCDIEIISEFSSQIGFGSSAAVTAAMLAIMNHWLPLSYSSLELARFGRTIIRNVQGQGSGADVAACIMGGIVYYRAEPFSIEKLSVLHPLTAVYSGSKLPTPAAISKVEQAFANQRSLFQSILDTIGKCAEAGKQAILRQDWSQFGEIMNAQQKSMDALGVTTPILQEIIYNLRGINGMLGAKISGSGFGDCVIGLGSLSENDSNIQMTDRGVVCEQK